MLGCDLFDFLNDIVFLVFRLFQTVPNIALFSLTWVGTLILLIAVEFKEPVKDNCLCLALVPFLTMVVSKKLKFFNY